MNKELALRVLNKIEQNPDTWDQECYANVCGTKFCFAGHTVHEVYPGATPNFYPGQTDAGSFLLNGNLLYYRIEAIKLLDLTKSQAWDLFDPTNTLDTIRRLIG